MPTWDSIERGLGRFHELVRADRRVEEEFVRSRGEFFASPEAAHTPMAELRHLEWFLLERPSAVLGSTPVQAWQERWRGSSPEGDGELATSLLQSLPGAFEVTSLAPGEVWARDLFTLGEHPVVETRFLGTLAVGDLLVGRLFPAGEGGFLMSPSVTVFRNAGLLAAVRGDLEAMRATRRGVLRVQQLELERLFHRPGAAPMRPRATTEVRERALAELLKQGLSKKAAAELLERVQEAARASKGQAITDILNGLAFETGVDLVRARLVLVDLWDSERLLREEVAPVSDTGAEGRHPDARTALAAFDRGRAEGKDLEQLFRDLERDLGIEGEDGDEDSLEEDEAAPDFPGVIGAMVEEFLWELEREQGGERARRWSVLRALGRYGRDIGVFEDLGTRLLDFSARWLLDESGISDAEAEPLLEALTAFCQWCEERHDLPLWRRFGATLQSLQSSLPRHMALRHGGLSDSGSGSYRVIRVEEREALVSDGNRERTVTLSPHQAAHLRSGDLVRLAVDRGRPLLGATYPGELRGDSVSPE